MLGAQPARRSAGAYYCACCNVHCSDDRTAQQHLAGLSHRQKSGELAAERQRFKEDASVTAADVMALVERKRVEFGTVPWSELRVQPNENFDTNSGG
ncbi:hypothetical protein ERJ75_000937900 [Trypanosoma vivax]|uniref:U1-type domain-containing protein n=1 Tax=Trypanosoma vivax (strain Y486) TaxID=1055687 RepID=G0U487_TRYVY|nr:hypothetical protein ERJ75_000937900 [Trypanosoma vivax]CCC52250.1 conserved hypothetical protein [Trypanosoma vivax Y486]